MNGLFLGCDARVYDGTESQLRLTCQLDQFSEGKVTIPELHIAAS